MELADDDAVALTEIENDWMVGDREASSPPDPRGIVRHATAFSRRWTWDDSAILFQLEPLEAIDGLAPETRL